MVRALIPDRRAGAYLLYRGGRPAYAGRSDHNLRRRLLAHALDRRGDHFEYQMHRGPHAAFDLECALFHALGGGLENRIHPASPAGSAATCFICQSASAALAVTGCAVAGGFRPLLPGRISDRPRQ